MAWDYKTNNPNLSDDFKDKYTINIKGKDYVTVNGLLALAHEKGIKSLKTKIVQFPNKDNDMTAIVEATVEGYSWCPIENKVIVTEFTAIGDANSRSVANQQIAPHYVRMGETRAVGRVLRNYTNIGMLAIEEMGSVIELPKITIQQVNRIAQIMQEKNITKDVARATLSKTIGKEEVKTLTPDEADTFIKELQNL